MGRVWNLWSLVSVLHRSVESLEVGLLRCEGLLGHEGLLGKRKLLGHRKLLGKRKLLGHRRLLRKRKLLGHRRLLGKGSDLRHKRLLRDEGLWRHRRLLREKGLLRHRKLLRSWSLIVDRFRFPGEEKLLRVALVFHLWKLLGKKGPLLGGLARLEEILRVGKILSSFCNSKSSTSRLRNFWC